MRFNHLCVAAFVAAHPIVASVCKPSTRIDSASGVSSATSDEIQATSTASTELSFTITTVTLETATSESGTSQTSVASIYTESSADAIPATTTSVTQDPIPGFDIAAQDSSGTAQGAPLNGRYLRGMQTPGFVVGWPGPRVIMPDRLTFSQVSSGHLQDAYGNMLCVQYAYEPTPNFIKTCDANMLSQSDYSLVTCEQTQDRTLHCSAPVKTCTFDDQTEVTSCKDVQGELDSFYTYHAFTNGVWLTMASSSSPPIGDNFHSINLGVVAH